MVNCRPSSLAMLLAYMSASLQSPQAIGPALFMKISSLLGCGLCTGVLSEVFRYLLPGEGTAPASVPGAGTTSQLQKVVLDLISGHDLSRHADPVSSVHCKSNCNVGRKSPRDYRGVSFIPGPPSCSLASSSGPPFVSYSSGKGWDVVDAISRFASGPGGTSETSSFASLGILCIRRILYGGLGRLNNERA